MFTQDVKLSIFRTILDTTDEEVTHMAEAAARMVYNMEFEASCVPGLKNDHQFLYNLEGAKLAQIIAQQVVADIGKPAAERECNLRGLCAMLEIEHYEKMPGPEDLPDLSEYGIKF